MGKIVNGSGITARIEGYPFGTTLGSDIAPTTQHGASVLLMPKTAIGIYNEGGTAVTCLVVPAGNDHTKPIKAVVNPNDVWRVCSFEAVIVAGSTGHMAATTHYLTDHASVVG